MPNNEVYVYHWYSGHRHCTVCAHKNNAQDKWSIMILGINPLPCDKFEGDLGKVLTWFKANKWQMHTDVFALKI